MNNKPYLKKISDLANKKTIILKPFLIFFITGVLLVPAGLHSQSKPFWLNEGWRDQNYPASSFLRDFAFDDKSPDETVGEAVERISEIARANLSLTVLSTIESTIESFSENFNHDGQHTYNEHFQIHSKSESYMAISGVNVETYYDETEQMVYALAHANKFEVIGYYKARIQMELQKINNIIDQAWQYEEELKKVTALAHYESAIPVFADIAFARGLLIAIDNVEGPKYMVDEINHAQKTINDALIRLSNAISICIISNENIFGESQNNIKNSVKGLISSGNFNFVNSAEDAEWVLEINANAREFNETHGIYFSYLDADVKLTRTASQTNIYRDRFSVKGGHKNSFLEAARQAGRELSETISNAVLENID